jgi:hypothetical protein
LQVANAIRSGHGRTCEHALAPGLLPQPFRKYWCELFQLIYVLRLAHQREGKLPGLFKLAVVKLKALH